MTLLLDDYSDMETNIRQRRGDNLREHQTEEILQLLDLGTDVHSREARQKHNKGNNKTTS